MRSIRLADTIYLAFTTRAFVTGIPTTLAGTPVVKHYEDATLTPMTDGITLSVDHDGITGLNILSIVATGANGFASGMDYNLVITTGTVGGVSVIGEVVGQFSIERDAVNVVKISDDAAAATVLKDMYLNVITAGAVSDAGPTASDFDTDLTEVTDNHYRLSVCIFTGGVLKGQHRKISVYTGSSKNIAVSSPYTDSPANGDPFLILGRIE